MKRLAQFVILLLSASNMEAQIAKQAFFGSGLSVAWSNGAKTSTSTVGFALVMHVSKKIFLRPVVSGGEVVPLNSAQAFPMIQGGCLFGYRATQRFSVLSGFAETVQFPKAGEVYLPTALISTAIRVRGHWGIFAPITVTARGYSISLQTGYTW